MGTSGADATEAPVRVSVLGALRIEVGGHRIEGQVPDKAALVVVYVADAGGPVRRSVLAGLLWSDVAEDRARANLRVALTRLRSVIGDHLHGDRERVWIGTAVDYDAAAVDDADAPDHAASVLRRYDGDFLEGLAIAGAELFDDWAAARRQNLRATALGVLSRAAGDAQQAADWPACRQYAQRVVEIEPWNEVAHRQLMAADGATSGPAAALARYEACARILDDELGLTPSPETTALLDQITAGSTDKAATGASAVGVPADLTPFFGREAELALLCERLLTGDYRLLTITGPGGVGKTRLAAEAARATADGHPGGVYFIPLAAITTDAELQSVILDVVAPDALQSAADPRERLVEVIGDRHLCLVLDNFEQLVEGGRDTVITLLQRCPNLRILTTSRQPLDVRGEDLFALQGLATPEPGDLDVAASPAVRLFADRAYRVDKTFSLAGEDPAEVAQLCRLLEGIPLHIELTAARMGARSVAELTAMLNDELGLPGDALLDAPDRHRTFDAVFEQSWITLDTAEQRALASLSVTRGGFDDAAAHAVVDSSGYEASRLARKSLLVAEGHGRFRFHELVRQSAASRLTDRPGAEARHARWYLGQVADAAGVLVSSAARPTTERLVRDLDNVRAAWRYGLAHGLTEQLGRAARGLEYLFEFAGRKVEAPALTLAAADAIASGQLRPAGDFDEAFFLRITARTIAIETDDDTVDRLCDRIDDLLADRPDRRADRAWTMLHRAQAAFYRGDLARSAAMVDRAERDAESLEVADHTELRAWSLLQRGRLLSAGARFDEAVAIYREALALFEAADDVRAQTLAHSYLAPTFAEQNKVWEAYEADRNAMMLADSIGNRQRMASLHQNVGASLVLLGEFEAALRHTATALELHRAAGDAQIEGYTLAQHGECLVALGRHDEGERDFVEGIALTRRQGFSYGLLYNLPPWIRYLQGRDRHEQALVAAEELVEIAIDRDAPHFALTGQALIARSQAALGRLDQAALLADGVHAALHEPDPPRLPWPVATLCDLAVTFGSIGDPRAADAIVAAKATQSETARSITDPELRRTYLERLPASIELAALTSPSA